MVCERYTLSSFVYQGITCGKELPQELNAPFPFPEALIFFDIDPDRACQRLEARQVKDIYETLAFQARVREAYHEALPRYKKAGVRVAVVDASAPEETVADALWRELKKLPILEA